MRYRATTALLLGLTVLAAGPALAKIPRGGVDYTSAWQYPGAPKPVYDDPKPAYPMNYADEAVQSLGFQNGHMDVFSAKPAESQSYLPAVSGGVGAEGAMLKLQWHPGE